MKVYNLTDVATPALKVKGLMDAHIRIGDTVVKSGTMEQVPDKHRAQTQKYVLMGAMAVDRLPKNYQGKARPASLEEKETEAADPPPPAVGNRVPPPPGTELSPEPAGEDGSGGEAGGSDVRKPRRSRQRTSG